MLSGRSSPPPWTSVWSSASPWGWCSSWGAGAVPSSCVWCHWSGPSQQVTRSRADLGTGRAACLRHTLAHVGLLVSVGNCAVIGPSECSPHTAELLHRLLPFYLDNVRISRGMMGWFWIFNVLNVRFVVLLFDLNLKSPAAQGMLSCHSRRRK